MDDRAPLVPVQLGTDFARSVDRALRLRLSQAALVAPQAVPSPAWSELPLYYSATSRAPPLPSMSSSRSASSSESSYHAPTHLPWPTVSAPQWPSPKEAPMRERANLLQVPPSSFLSVREARPVLVRTPSPLSAQTHSSRKHEASYFDDFSSMRSSSPSPSSSISSDGDEESETDLGSSMSFGAAARMPFPSSQGVFAELPTPLAADTLRQSTLLPVTTTNAQAGPSSQPTAPRRVVTFDDATASSPPRRPRPPPRRPRARPPVDNLTSLPKRSRQQVEIGKGSPLHGVCSTDYLLDPPWGAEDLDMRFLEYRGFIPRLIYLCWPLFVFYHVLATIFFDFTALYILGQLATAPRSGESARAWWVALGVYALCTAIWLVGVVGWHECWRGLVRTSRMDERKLQLRDVYLSAVRFNGACMRSYGFFCCLIRIRLAAWSASDDLSAPSTRLDGILETAWWYSQNWPTVLLAVPRAAVALVLILVLGTNSAAVAEAGIYGRDGAFFDSAGALTLFAFGTLLAHVCWTAWRAALVAVSFATSWLLLQLTEPLSSSHRPARRASEWHAGSQEKAISWPIESDRLGFVSEAFDAGRVKARVTPPSWQEHLSWRIRAAVALCLPRTRRYPRGEADAASDEKDLHHRFGALERLPLTDEAAERRRSSLTAVALADSEPVNALDGRYAADDSLLRQASTQGPVSISWMPGSERRASLVHSLERENGWQPLQ